MVKHAVRHTSMISQPGSPRTSSLLPEGPASPIAAPASVASSNSEGLFNCSYSSNINSNNIDALASQRCF
jgi:hypothetical protein